MKRSASLLLAAAVALLTAGCETSGVSARINEKAAVYNALPPEQQEMIRQGEIEVGFTADMVYLSLGKPSKVQTKDTADGPVTVWTYSKYFPNDSITRITMSRDGGMTYAPPMVSANQPNASSNPAGLRPQSFGGGSTVQSQMGVELGEIPTDTLYVFLFQDRVFQIKLASQG
jgi:hypothetical protein